MFPINKENEVGPPSRPMAASRPITLRLGTFAPPDGIVADHITRRPAPEIMQPILTMTIALAIAGSPLSARQAGGGPQGSQARRGFIRLAGGLGETGYNRVEGLAAHLGVEGRSAGLDPFEGRGMLIARTDRATGLDQVGYLFRVEKRFLGPRRLAVGVQAHSQVQPIESRGVSVVDNSLSSALFKRDTRDYYDSQGFVAFVTYAPERSILSAAVEFRTEDQQAVATSGAGSLFFNDRSWRFQPQVGGGWVTSLAGGVRIDTRARRRFDRGPGWEVEVELTQGLGGDLDYPSVGIVRPDRTLGPPVAGIPPIKGDFTAGRVDVRRFNQIGNLQLNARLVAEGALTGDALPPQFQHALGGRGSLPGLPTLALTPDAPAPAMDCGARTRTVANTEATGFVPGFYPFYGCDRYAMLQVQLEGYLGFRFGTEAGDLRDEQLGVNLELVPRWVVFFDAAQAWAQADFGPFPRSDEDRKYDAGGGIAFGDLGLYVAVPLQGDDHDPVFVARWGSRF